MTEDFREREIGQLEGLDDEALVSELQQVGPSSERGKMIVTILFGRHYPRLTAIVTKSYANLLKQQAVEDADDLVMAHLRDIFFSARKLNSFGSQGPGSFGWWLNRAFVNFLNNRYRRTQRRRSQSLETMIEQSWATGQRLHPALSHPALQEPCDLLDDPCIRTADRELLYALYIEEVPLEEIAARNGKKIGAMRMQRQRALERVAKCLQSRAPP